MGGFWAGVVRNGFGLMALGSLSDVIVSWREVRPVQSQGWCLVGGFVGVGCVCVLDRI